MIKITDKSSTGKTKRLMELAESKNGVFVCDNPSAALIKARAYGILNLSIVSYDEFNKDTEKNSKKPYFIDEIEKYLKFSYGRAIGGFTMTLED